MAQIFAYQRYWDRHPPTHILAASFMGYKAPAADLLSQAEKREKDIERIAGMMGVPLPAARPPDVK